MIIIASVPIMSFSEVSLSWLLILGSRQSFNSLEFSVITFFLFCPAGLGTVRLLFIIKKKKKKNGVTIESVSTCHFATP